MADVKFTRADRKLMHCLIGKEHQIMRKLVSMIGEKALRKPCHKVDLEAFLGKGCDWSDCLRISRELAKIPAIVRDVEFGLEELRIFFRPEALPTLRKIAIRDRESHWPKGDGELYCNAMLALKRAFGMRGDVWYNEDFGYANFDFGEDVTCMSIAFRSDCWHMEFSEKRDGSNFEIRVMPIYGDGDKLEVTSEIDFSNRKLLATISRAEFIDPERWGKLIPQIVARARI